MEKEIWRPVSGFKGSYEVSNLGRVRSIDRIVTTKTNQSRFYRGKILSLIKNNKTGYMFVLLGQGNIKMVHRLVADAFIADNGTRVVHHKDHNKENNRLDNLERCTHKQNSEYAIKDSLGSDKWFKEVIQLSYNGKPIKSFNSQKEAAEELGLKQGAISNVCNHRMNSTGGYRFMFKSQYEAMMEDAS